MIKELTENLADFIQSTKTLTPNSGGWHKNVIRGVRADGTDIESKPLNRANSMYSGIEGDKSYHDSNRAFLSMINKEDKVGKRKRKYRIVKNALGKEVRQGHTKIVKKKDIK